MMDFTQVLKDADGGSIRDDLYNWPPETIAAMQQGATLTPPELTLGAAAYYALISLYRDEAEIGGEEKFLRAELAVRVKSAKDAQLSSDEFTLIRELIGKRYAGLVILAAWNMLDAGARNAPQEPSAKEKQNGRDGRHRRVAGRGRSAGASAG